MYPRFTRIPDDDVQIFDGGLIALFGVRACNVDSAFSLSQIVAVQEVAFAAPYTRNLHCQGTLLCNPNFRVFGEPEVMA
jgi:hypothetical protein